MQVLDNHIHSDKSSQNISNKLRYMTCKNTCHVFLHLQIHVFLHLHVKIHVNCVKDAKIYKLNNK